VPEITDTRSAIVNQKDRHAVLGVPVDADVAEIDAAARNVSVNTKGPRTGRMTR